MSLPFPEVIDSSMRDTFNSCPHKFWWQYMRHLAPSSTNVHLLAGGAFAKGMEVTRKAYYMEGTDTQTAVGRGMSALIATYGDFEPPANSPKTCEGMLGAFDHYFHAFPLDTDTIKPHKGSIEFTFGIPIPHTAHPTTGNPIIYAGRFDMLGEMNGQLFVVDEKTTTSLGFAWSNQWDLRGQMLGYMWAARQFGWKVDGALIRGVSILKKSYGHAQAIMYRQEWLEQRWLQQLVRDVQRMVECWASDTWDQNFGSACSAYGACPYKLLCSSADPEPWITGNYVEHLWSPLNP